jgi:hypothetical protein
LKAELKGRHFDTAQAMEAESQAELNTFPERVYKMAEALGTVHARGRGWKWPVGPKLVLDQMAAPVPEIVHTISYVSIRTDFSMTEIIFYDSNYAACHVMWPRYHIFGFLCQLQTAAPVFPTLLGLCFLCHLYAMI